MSSEPRPLREVLAAGVKEARLQRGLRQEDAAARARAFGLSSWIRGTVAQAEVGARRLGLEDLLLLSLAYETTLAELVVGEDHELVELTPSAAVRVGTLRALLSGQRVARAEPESGVVEASATKQSTGEGRTRRFPKVLAADERFGMGKAVLPERRPIAWGEAERYAARKLGATPERIHEAAMRRWGRSLSEERDLRVADRAAEASPRRLQALRGHITRELLAELDEELQGLP